jgi:apolipoprotein N-acyltransferase
MVRGVAAVISGAALAAAFPPFGLAPLGWAAAGLFLWLVASAASRAQALLTGYLFGLAFFSTVMWWLANVELIAFYPLMLLEAFGFLLVAAVVYRWRDGSPSVFMVAAAGSWALAEFVRVRWPFGGFPWATLGLSISNTPLRQSAQFVGASGWSVILVAIAAVAVAWARGRRGPRLLVGLAGGAVALGLLGLVVPAVAEGGDLRVAIVQGNSPCPGDHCPDERLQIFEAHLELTRTIPAGSVDLVVWPESSTGFGSHPLTDPAVAEAIGEEARRIGAVLLIGGDRSGGPDHFINSNAVFDPSGSFVVEYLKMHPVPFGEFVPYRRLLSWIPALDRVPRDMVRGDGPVVFEVAGGEVASVISYEGAFARYERSAVRQGAQLIVVATNEASFGESPASDQFIAISRVRAAELGTDIVHAAVTGRSAFVSSSGPVTGELGLFESGLSVDTLHLRDAGWTVYTATGDLLQVLAMLSVGALLMRRSATSVLDHTE